MLILQLLELMDSINWIEFLWGSIIMICVYVLTVMINIRITQGEFGNTQGRFKAYCIAAFFGVVCNASELLIYKLKISDNEWIYILEVIGLVYVSFCIMITYTFPWWAAILWGTEVTLMQGLFELKCYKYSRVIPLIIINSIEIIFASFIVRSAYRFDYCKALFIIAMVGLIFNLLLVAINGIILDYITKDKYRQKINRC